MKTTEARLDRATLAAVQEARGRVPLAEFRLKECCAECNLLASQPVSNYRNVYRHILTEHADEVIT